MPPVLEPVEFQNDVAVVRGSPVVLPCEAQGSPPPRVSWMKDGEPLFQGLEQGPSLQLQTVGAGDSGTYSCVAVSEAGEARRQFRLTVMGGSSASCTSFSRLGQGVRGVGAMPRMEWGGGVPGGLGLPPGYRAGGPRSSSPCCGPFYWGHTPWSCPPNLVKGKSP